MDIVVLYLMTAYLSFGIGRIIDYAIDTPSNLYIVVHAIVIYSHPITKEYPGKQYGSMTMGHYWGASKGGGRYHENDVEVV